MSKETWQNKFLNAGTENGCGDLSIMISTVSDIREEAVLEERRRVLEIIGEEVDLEQLERYRDADFKLAPNSYGAGHSYGNWEMAYNIFSLINKEK